MRLRILLVGGVLTLGTLCGPCASSAFAQGGTSADRKAGSASEASSVKQGASTDPTTPGATGSTVVPGNHSTVAGDASATNKAKSGGGGGLGGK